MVKSPLKIETSWDDGGALDVRIASILKKYPKLSGTFYVIVDKIGQDGFLTWEQIKDIERQGFEIGSHTMTHSHNMKDMYDEELHYEIQNSKDILEAVLGHPVGKFCYPRGRYDDRIREFVIRAGYTEARATGKPGVLDSPDPYGMRGTLHIFKRPEYGATPIFEFAKKTIDKAIERGGYINIWGHSAEIQKNNLWGTLEEVLAYANSKL